VPLDTCPRQVLKRPVTRLVERGLTLVAPGFVLEQMDHEDFTGQYEISCQCFAAGQPIKPVARGTRPM
jgi:glutamine synthetase